MEGAEGTGADRDREGEQRQNAQETKTQRGKKAQELTRRGGFGCTDRGLCLRGVERETRKRRGDKGVQMFVTDRDGERENIH